MPDSLLTIDEVAKRLAMCERSVRTLVHLGHLPKITFLSSSRFDPADVDAFIESRRSKPPAGRGKPPPPTPAAPATPAAPNTPGADGKAP